MIPIITTIWPQLGSTVASFLFVWAIFQQYFPYEIRHRLRLYADKFMAYAYPYIHITFHEYHPDRFGGGSGKAYAAVERYLGANSSTKAKRLKADLVKDSQSLVLSMDDQEEITDEFNGVKLSWASRKHTPRQQTISFYRDAGEKKFYRLSFHRRHRDLVIGDYLKHVLKEGRAIAVRNRQRKLYTNARSDDFRSYRFKSSAWSHVVFEHPATFQTLAMEGKKKQEVISDLFTFSKAKDYYAKIGKAWKRGYLLYGPPGTGKSTMIAAMANLLEYDVYDLELTSVRDNTELRKLLIETTSKSIIVIEDIDCSLDLTGQRKEKKKKKDEDEKDEKNPVEKMKKKEDEIKDSKVTLSGLLNFIDGLWSACASERIIVFTTNYVEKLDPALIRRGRMDKHIQLSYCCFDAFKILAKNYLDLDFHHLFDKIEVLLGEVDMTPADVAENLMPKSSEDNAETRLESLMKALLEAKEAARLKAEEEEEKKERLKAEEEEEEQERLKAQKEEKEKEQKVEEEMKEKEIDPRNEENNNGVVN